MLQLSDWLMETSLRDGAVLVFTLVLWKRDPSKVRGVLLLVKLFGVRPSVAAL